MAATTVAAIVLAAGMSSRFEGGNKLLTLTPEGPLIAHPVRQLLTSRVREIVVVTGHDGEAVAAVLGQLPLRIIHNGAFASGMGGSIAAGIAAVASADGAMIVPGDMPALPSQLIDDLITTFEDNAGKKIVFPVLPGGEQVNPVIWPRSYFSHLLQLKGSSGAKPLIRSHAEMTVPVVQQDEAPFLDIDTRADLHHFLSGAQ